MVINEIQEFINSCPEGSEIKHTLKMTNCGSIDFKNFDKKIPSYDVNGVKSRATSFTIYAFPIKNNATDGYVSWDEGVGFDSNADFWLSGASSVSDEGSNWFNRKSGLKWINEGCIGMYPDKSNVIAYQHFDHGNENIEFYKYIDFLLHEDTLILIRFYVRSKEIYCNTSICMKELQAINKKCKELGWI